MTLAIERIISGGQTGVDRAALDVALLLAIPCGGWCPRGRKAEDGLIADRYPLQETRSRDYRHRTKANVLASDGTLILYTKRLMGGTALTLRCAKGAHRPYCLVDLNLPPSPSNTLIWINNHSIRVLNVAGPRESQAPGIYWQARRWLLQLFARDPSAVV
ncbi:MAG: putative molybdenum carrier protein [Gammaproteobacteria bacterium]